MKIIYSLFFVITLASISFAGKYHPTIQYLFPLPSSKLLPQKTTIILRLEPDYGITDLTSLIHVQGDSQGVYSGDIFYATDGRTIIFKPDNSFKIGEQINVTIETSQFSGHDFAFHFTIDTNQPQTPKNEQDIHSVRPANILEVHEIPPPRIINGVTVPSDFPKIETQQKGATAPGLIFFGTNFPEPGTGNYLIACYDDGTPYFYRRFDKISRSVNFTPQPTGVLTVHFEEPGHYLVLDSNFVEIDSYTCGHGYTTDNHEFLLLENGHALIIAQEDIKIDMSALVPRGRKTAIVQGNHIQELDQNKNVIFEWRSWDYLDIRDAIGINLTANYIDYAHINSIAVDYDSNLVISSRDLCEVTKINRNTGDIIWRLGGENNQFEFINETEDFLYQHDARPVPGKPRHYTIFDNGRSRTRPYSRAVEYKIDVRNKIAEKVWEFRHNPDRFSKSMGGAQRLPNGNTLIDWPADKLRVCEVSPDGKIVYELFSAGHTNYRCRRYQWSGMQKQPYLILENFGAVVRLIFNKFGDANTEYYKIYYSTTGQDFTFLDRTNQTYYDMTYLQNHTEYFFRVTAVDSPQAESGFSNTERAFVQLAEPGQNLIRNGTFESFHYWTLATQNQALAETKISVDAPLLIDITNGSYNIKDIQLQQDNILLLKNRSYRLKFDAYTTKDFRVADLDLLNKDDPATDYSQIGLFALKRRPEHFEFTFRMQQSTDSDARFVLHCGGDTSNIYIDNIVLTHVDLNYDTTFVDFVKINFQPDSLPAPEAYARDSGDMFGIRPNGFSYGWDTANNNSTSRELILDPRYTTFNYLKSDETDYTWEIEVPNGEYEIHLVTGDPAGSNAINQIRIENDTFTDADGPDLFDEFTTETEIADGRLTLKPAGESPNLKICFIDIRKRETASVRRAETKPHSMRLAQNYPNPFNQSTIISFSIAQRTPVNLKIYDLLGRVVRTVLEEPLDAGNYALKWQGTDNAGNPVASGIYFYTLETEFYFDVKKLILLK